MLNKDLEIDSFVLSISYNQWVFELFANDHLNHTVKDFLNLDWKQCLWYCSSDCLITNLQLVSSF